MRRIIATSAAVTLAGGGFAVAVFTMGATAVAPAAAPASQSHAQLVPRTHPNGTRAYTTIQVGSSWSAVTPKGKKFQVQPNGKKFG